MAESSLKIIFMGTPDFAAVALQSLIDSGHEVICAYSQPPRPKGRGHKVQKSPVHRLADENNIPVYTPKSLKSQEDQELFAAHNADIAVVAAYGLLLPEEVLNAPKYDCLNIHASILPRWRGASPIQHAIWKGDDISGVTIMQMDKGLDTGDMIATSQIPIDNEMSAAKLHDALAEIGGELVIDVLNDFAEDKEIQYQKQDNELSNYAPLLKKSDGKINWQQSAVEIDRQVRALTPWPGVWSVIGDKRFKMLQTQVTYKKTDKSAGTILDKDGSVSCGDKGILKIITIQPEGKKAMDFTSVLNGGYLKIGDVFS